jgi:hypothetical protein
MVDSCFFPLFLPFSFDFLNVEFFGQFLHLGQPCP